MKGRLRGSRAHRTARPEGLPGMFDEYRGPASHAGEDYWGWSSIFTLTEDRFSGEERRLRRCLVRQREGETDMCWSCRCLDCGLVLCPARRMYHAMSIRCSFSFRLTPRYRSVVFRGIHNKGDHFCVEGIDWSCCMLCAWCSTSMGFAPFASLSHEISLTRWRTYTLMLVGSFCVRAHLFWLTVVVLTAGFPCSCSRVPLSAFPILSLSLSLPTGWCG